MQLTSADRRHMERALTLAATAAAFASPNPTVGCVLVRDAVGSSPEVLGEGAHRYDARDHAEILALKAAAAAGHSVQGTTAFVTLEPCSHHGRTGPCADALIAAGISRCVVATVDPNPLVRGQGIARLRAAGVVVDLLDPTDALAQRARRLNDAFAFSIQHGRPFVTLKAAVSGDGKLAPDPATRAGREPFWLTGTAARADVQQLRHEADALLTGVGTVLADDPALTDRTGLPRRKPLVRVVLDTHLRTPLSSEIVSTATHDLLLFCGGSASKANEDSLRARGAQVIRLPLRNDRLDLNFVLSALTPFRNLLVEAGSTLNGALLEDDLVDKLVVYTAPTKLGPRALPFAMNRALPALERRLTSPARHSFPHGNAEDSRLTGYLHDPWTGL